LGQLLAQQHKTQTQNMYGWQEDNFIGLSSQPNQWQKKWCHFFAEQTYRFYAGSYLLKRASY